MDKNIMEKYNQYINDLKIIDEDFIFEFIYNYIEEKKLEKYLDDITFDKNSIAIAMYFINNKRINLNLDKIYKSATQSMYIKEFNRGTVLDINNTILATVIHEIIHVEQRKIIIEKTKQPEIITILKESFSDRSKHSSLYKKHHDLFLIEYNANMEAKFKIAEIASEVENVNKAFFAKFIHENLMDTYVFDDLGTMSPLEKYRIIKNNYSELGDYSNISEYDQLIYGLPINAKTYQKIYDLKKEKSFEPKTYFKTK